nr:T9SS type A sorting domain-containing protein [uncultured Flavobacterium sp.]
MKEKKILHFLPFLFFSIIMLFAEKLTAQTNLARLTSTKITTSHVSPWESLNAVNDGFTPISSEDRTNPVYGNWDGEAAYNTYNWIEYEWDFAHEINSVAVYWFTDYGGIGQPTDAYIQYWDGISWVNAGGIGLALNQFNTIENLSFKSRKLRIYMKSATATGVTEFQAFGIQTTECNATELTANLVVNNGQEKNVNFAVISSDDNVQFKPSIANMEVGAKMKWSGPNNFTSLDQNITLSNLQEVNSGTYTFLYINNCGTESSVDFYLTVKGENSDFTSWPAYDSTLHYDFKSDYPDFPKPLKNLEEDYPGYSGCNSASSRNYGSWTFVKGPNANPLVTDVAVDALLKRLDGDFTFLRDNMGWPPDKLYRAGYRSSVYLYGSGLCTDTASNTDLGGWQSGVGTPDGESWPMVLLSYYPVASFDPNTTFPDAQYQTGACTHEGIHAIYASLPGCRKSAWFHEGSNVWLQTVLDIKKTGSQDYSNVDLGWLSAGSVIAPFIPIECYSGWLQDGTFGGPSAEGVDSGVQNENGVTLRLTRDIIGGVQYSSVFPTFLGEIVGEKSLPWIWNYCEGRVLEGIANGNGTVNGIGDTKIRKMVQEYRARLALADFGKFEQPILSLYRNNMGRELGPEQPALINVEKWKATPYAKTTTGENGYLIPEEKTLPGWSGANFIPIHVQGNQATLFFEPLGKNMSIQLCYRTKEGKTIYSQPVYAGDCTISFDQGIPANGVIFAVICNSDYIFKDESTRKTKFNYKIKLGEGAISTAGIDKNWWDWKAVISENLSVVNNSGSASNFIIYPNPTNISSLINIKLPNTNSGTVGLKITNTQGQVIFEKRNYNPEEQYYTGGLSQGVYFVTVETQNFKQTKKIIVK